MFVISVVAASPAVSPLGDLDSMAIRHIAMTFCVRPLTKQVTYQMRMSSNVCSSFLRDDREVESILNGTTSWNDATKRTVRRVS